MEKVSKQVLTTEDMMIILNCQKETARKKMTEIRAVSDIWKIKGIIALADYECYIESKKGKVAK